MAVHEKEIEIRWRDLDAFGHVNHAVFLTYLEEARDEWAGLTLLGDRGAIWDYVVARVAVDYKRELTQADDVVTVRCDLASVGTSSLRTKEEILTAAGELAATAEAVLVARSPETGRSRPLTDAERAALGE